MVPFTVVSGTLEEKQVLGVEGNDELDSMEGLKKRNENLPYNLIWTEIR